MKKLTVTAEISTKDRYFSSLNLTILSIIQQTVKPDKLVIYDDGEQKDLREDNTYRNLFTLLSIAGIEWKVNFGERKGQVLNHQKIISEADTDLIWRVDDDDILEPNVLEKLLPHFDDPQVGAVGCIILMPTCLALPKEICSGKIEDVWGKPNIQWSNQDKVIEVEHFNNSFLYRREYAKHGYNMNLSPAGHSEESLFSYGFKRSGYKLILEPSVKIWHLKNPSGGIRSYSNSDLWKHDTAVAIQQFKDWGITLRETKLIVLDCGLGDHCAFLSVFKQIKARYAGKRIQLAVCFPQLFEDEKDIDILSIADAYALEGNIINHNIYKWMSFFNWKKSLAEAFLEMYK